MASFISALALFILVLSNGCLTLPILDEQLSSSTYSSINDDVTTEKIVNLRFVSDDETSVLPNVETKRSTDEHMGYEISTYSTDLSGNKFVQALRSFDEYSTSEPIAFTTENSNSDKREYEDLPFTTVEPITEVGQVDRRSIVNEFENVTENSTQQIQVETTTNDILSFTSTSTFVVPEFHTSESSTFVVPELHTSESSTLVIPEFHTSESSTFIVPELHTSTSVVPEFHTSESPTSTLTSSSVASIVDTPEPSTSTFSSSSTVPKVYRPKSSSVVPNVYKPKSSTFSSTTTEKYIGLLKDESEQEEEYEQTTKYMKFLRKSPRKSFVSSTINSPVYVEDKSEEKEEEPSVPTAVFDQQALDKVSNIPSDFLILDENNDLVVTGLPNKIFTTTMAHQIEEAAEEEKPLNQGSTLLLFLLAALLFCACVLASTLAFVKNRHTLKRKSRITEMEAHLDQHYLYPFMFHQHHEKQ